MKHGLKMHFLTRTARIFISAFVLTITFQTTAATNDSFTITLQEQMPALLATNHVPGAVVSYIKNGEVVWTKAFGVANLKTGTPMQPDMVFNHGSDGKVLTAWGIMRLVEEGKVNRCACQSLFETLANSFYEVRSQ
jgi:CubicO group peptidase (beta-lactamase class C family)